MKGRLLFARHAFAPNRLGYCGGPDSQDLFDYAAAAEDDGGLAPLLRQFTGAYPYLQFIASASGIPDPLDQRVVEAYWLGNKLLERVDSRRFHRWLRERFLGRLASGDLKYALQKPAQGALPHHSFHVLEMQARTGLFPLTVEFLDQCRIGWGTVRAVEDDLLLVERQPIVLEGGRLVLGPSQLRRVQFRQGGRGFISRAQPGDTVSLHWDWACSRLTPRQKSNVENYTRLHLKLANDTL